MHRMTANFIRTLFCIAAVLLATADGRAQTAPPWTTGVYDYDGAGNIVSIGGDAFVYDAYGRLHRATIDGAQQTFEYDGFGNITKITTGTNAVRLGVNAATNRLDRDRDAAGVAYDAYGSYDTDGSVLALGPDRFQPVPDGPMVEATVGGQRLVYVYTPTDERIGVVAVSTAGAELYSDWTLRDATGRPLRRYQRTSGIWRWEQDYIYRDGDLLATETSGPDPTIHFHPDHLGTPRLLTANGGVRIAEHKYSAFGSELTSSLQDHESVKFTGYERDSAGLDYAHARYYGVAIGRFLSIDPVLDESNAIAAPQTWNRYTYVANNPIRFNDPDGKELKEFLDAELWKDAGKGMLADAVKFGKDVVHAEEVRRAFMGFDKAPPGEKALSIAIGVIAAADVAANLITPEKAALQKGATKAGAIVLGHFDDALPQAAKKLGAEFLSIPNWSWGRNRGWLRDAVAQGKEVLLHTDPRKVRPGSVYFKELQWLVKRGYTTAVWDPQRGVWAVVKHAR
jgi:RHS repeat-associated protein